MNDSFSSKTKAELCKIPLTRPCCILAEAYGVLLYANSFTASGVRLMTENAAFAKRLPRLFQRAFETEFDSIKKPDAFGRRYIFTVEGFAKTASIYDKLGLDLRRNLSQHINLALLEEDCCRTSFLRGAFLAGGSISDPERMCRLELVTDHAAVTRELMALLMEMNFSPKQTVRGGHSVVYFKRSDAVEDFLTAIGASVSSLALMSARAEKEMRSAINRKVNCDSANADKIVSAAQEQLSKLRAFDRDFGLSTLQPELQALALLRIANPEASLTELAMLSVPPVSKSCINHRMRKLMSMCPQSDSELSQQEA